MNAIVVGVDGSDTARSAAKHAAALANSCGVPLHLVSAYAKGTTKTVTSGADTWEISSLNTAERLLTHVAGEVQVAQGITTAAVSGNPASAVIKEAKRLDASIIVVGNRRVQGVSRILGSVATDITRRAPCHVLIAKTT